MGLKKFNIRSYDPKDEANVIALWQQCGLTRPWNNPKLDIQRKMTVQPELFLVSEIDGKLMGSAMFGYDGHRGWLYYFAIHPSFQKHGLGKQLLERGEELLITLGCPKYNFQVRSDNQKAIDYYTKAGFAQEGAISFGKRLIED